jgi:proteic killer suppression protein
LHFTPKVKEGSREVLLEFERDELQRLYTDLDFRVPGLGPDLVKHFRRRMAVIAAAADERDLLAMRSLRFEKLLGGRAGQFSIRLNDQWRLILRFRTNADGRIAVIVDLVDYH